MKKIAALMLKIRFCVHIIGLLVVMIFVHEKGLDGRRTEAYKALRQGRMISFVVTALFLNIVPGPAHVYLACQTMKNGLSAGLMTLFGIELGSLCYLSAMLMGLGLLITQSSEIFLFFQMLGACLFTLYGIISLWRNEQISDAHFPTIPDYSNQDSHKFSLANTKYIQSYKGLCINLFNPKMLLFYIVLLPTLLNPELGNTSNQVVWYAGLFALIGAFIRLCIVGLATFGRKRLLIKNNPSVTILFWMQRFTSLVFIFFGVGIFCMVFNRL